MNIQDAYDEWSGIYDSNPNLTRDLDAQVIRETLASRRFRSILELGCGTGKNTVFLAKIAEQVQALDFSGGMIQKAREKVKSKNVRFEMADLTRRWNCGDSACDLIVCCLVLEHIEDLSHIFFEAARTLAPGGGLLINELHPFKQYGGAKARFARGAETVELPVFAHHISEFVNAAQGRGFALVKLDEYWHAEDAGKPPRLVSFMFARG